MLTFQLTHGLRVLEALGQREHEDRVQPDQPFSPAKDAIVVRRSIGAVGATNPMMRRALMPVYAAHRATR